MNKVAYKKTAYEKEYFEKLYSKMDPWGFNNTLFDRIRRAILLKHIEVVFSNGSRKTVLDAGCGEGYITKDMASKFNADIDAFDISENALAIARERNFHENISYFHLDVKNYAPNKEYDLILCEEILYYLDDNDRIEVVRKFHDSIKTGGYLRLTGIIIGETEYIRFFTPDSIRELVVSSGFQLVSIVPSVIQKKSFIEKVFYRLLEYMNRLNLVSPFLIEYLENLILNRPLNDCRAISLLAKKV